MSRRPLVLALALALPSAASATDLMQTYELARTGDPQLSIAEATRLFDKEGAVQARAALLPQVSGSVGYSLNHSSRPGNVVNDGNGGMRVDAVRPNSPAALEGMQPGDILVGMHRWETASETDIQYIISRPNFSDMGKVKFYVLRGQNTLYGHLNVAKADSVSQSTQRR